MKIGIAVILCFLFSPFIIYSQQDTTKEKVFEKIEIEASYPGGFPAWVKFLEKNLNGNVPVKNGAPAGKYSVYIQLIVDKDGSVTDMKALTNLGYGMETEVMRILKKSGAWQPATINGRAVKAYRKQPVTFMVTDEKFDISTYTIDAGKDNKITIDAGRIKAEDLKVTISRGTITPGNNGNFIIHVTGIDRVLITIYNSKKDNLIGTASLEVKSGLPN
jgi:hypothetical protein